MRETLRSIKQTVKGTYYQASQVYYNIAGNEVECNICHYKANHLASDSWHQYVICPNCESTVRHRLLVAAFQQLDELSYQKIIDGKDILHFAPEKKLEKMIRARADVYKTADFFAEGYAYKNIDFNLDISAMTSIPDGAYDCVIACDVLEHVPNHIAAINEVYRVLKPGGYCIFTVPQKDNLAVTIEDLTITDPKKRIEVFGQYDHLRIYGDDFTDTLTTAGFSVTAVDEHFFPKEVVREFVLFPPILSKNPLATNYRKVFFGKK